MAQWRRARLVVSTATREVLMTGMQPSVTLRSNADTGKLRIGLWMAGERVAGWLVPYLPADIALTIRRGKAIALVNGAPRDLPAHLRDWDGVRWPEAGQLPIGSFTVTLDQEPDKAVPVLVDVTTTAVGD